MDAVSQLIIASLFALHQYLPATSTSTKYFDYVVDPVTLEANYNSLTVLSAAHQTCRHLFTAGGKELGYSEEGLKKLAFDMLEEKRDKFLEMNTTPERVKEMIERLCSPVFDPQSFSREEAKSAENFVRTKIGVLTQKDLDSTGSYQFFGKVELFDRKGQLMGPLFTTSERWVPYAEIAKSMVTALVGAEDAYFFKHDGVYLGSLTRMAYQMTVGNESEASGGSTVTMQLLKNLYFASMREPSDSPFESISRMKTMLRKAREWYWAKIFEKYHERMGAGSGKRFVLETYLNLMDYGPSIRGIDQASHVFFQKSPDSLGLAESAFLASMFKGPSRYSRPSNYSKYTQGRRAYVLDQMTKLSMSEHGLAPIKVKDMNAALNEALPMWQANSPVSQDEDAASSYVRTYARDFITRDISLPQGQRIIEAELKSTIDHDLQKVVYDAVRERLDAYDEDREKLSRVGPARDDRSETATPTADDVSGEVRKALDDLQKVFDSLQVNVRLSVFLGDNGGEKSNKLFYHSASAAPALPLTYQQELNSKVSSVSRFVGQVIATEIQNGSCPGYEAGVQYKALDSTLSPLIKSPADAESPSITTLPLAETELQTNPAEETVIEDSFGLLAKDDPTIDAPDVVPLPLRRPPNADELVRIMHEKAQANMFLGLPVESRPAVQVPYEAPSATSCVRIVNLSELQGLGMGELFLKAQDTVSKRVVRNALLRMEALAPRANMMPAIYDGRDDGKPLVVAPSSMPEDIEAEYQNWIRPVALTTKSGNHANFVNKAIQRGNLRVGQIYWVAGTGKTEGVFRLVAPKLQAAVVAMNSETGEVLATFGGYEPGTSKFFDRSRLAARQPGSTLKPWLYYLALNKGFEPSSQIQNEGVYFQAPNMKPYYPDNFSEGSGSATVGFEDAFKNSLNKAAVGLLTDYRFGSDQMSNLREFHDLLLTVGLYDQNELPVVPSIALGSQGLSILDLVSSLTYFANGQHIARPRFFESFANGQGEKLYQSEAQFLPVPYSDQRLALFQMQSMLIEVANSGTAARLKKFALSTLGLDQCAGGNYGVMNDQVCFGGKTGTSSDAKDNWFMGISRNFVIGVWVGYDFPASTGSTGGGLAVPIFEDIVKKGKAYLPPIEPIVSSLPAGMNLVYLGPSGCQTYGNTGTPTYTRQDPSYIPMCPRCECSYQGTDGYNSFYALMIDGSPTYDTSWGEARYYTYEGCTYAQQWQCPAW